MDAINYILFKNPVVTYSIGTAKHIGSGLVNIVTKSDSSIPAKHVPLLDESFTNGLRMNRNFLRLAGAFGATAVVIGAYGAHTLLAREGNEQRKKIFQTGSQYHFYHLLALFVAPLCRYPKVTATTVASGMLIFCGSCYYVSLTGDESYRKITPYGGTLLILVNFYWVFILALIFHKNSKQSKPEVPMRTVSHVSFKTFGSTNTNK